MDGAGWLLEPTVARKPVIGPTCSLRVAVMDTATGLPLRKSRGFFRRKVESGTWKRVFGEHGRVSHLRPGSSWHFVCFRSVEEANQARDALDGTDGAQLVGGAGQSGGSDSWLAQHSEGLEVLSTRGAEEIGHTVIHIDWAVPQNIQHPLFDEMRDLQDRINPGWQKLNSKPRVKKNQKLRAHGDAWKRSEPMEEDKPYTVRDRNSAVPVRVIIAGSRNILEYLLMSSEVPTLSLLLSHRVMQILLLMQAV